MTMTIEPIGENCLFQEMKEDEIKGGIIIPEALRKKTIYFRINKVGDKVTTFKAGELVLLDMSTAYPIRIAETEELILPVKCIVGKITLE